MKIPISTKTDDSGRQFPLDVLPERLQNIVNEYGRAFQFHQDYVSLATLTALSAAIGIRYRIKIRNYHTEPAILWAILVGNPGIAKTHVIGHLFRPFTDSDDKRFDEYERDLQIYESEDAKGKKPRYYQAVLRDFTFEALAESASVNKHGSVILSDEILSLTGNFNKYNKGNDEPLYLTLWSGLGISATRKTQNAIHTKNSCINLIGGIQPNRLRDLLTKIRFDNGFADRFLFAYPDAVKEPWTDITFSPKVNQDYHDIINGIRCLSSEDEIIDIPLAPDAWQALKHWQGINTQFVNDSNEANDPMGGLRSKWESYVCRFALIIEMAHSFCKTGKAPDAIGIDSITGAIQLFDYYLSQTQKVFGLIARPEGLDSLGERQMKVYLNLPETFTRAKAVEIASKIGVPTPTLDRYLANSVYKSDGLGNYQKRAL